MADKEKAHELREKGLRLTPQRELLKQAEFDFPDSQIGGDPLLKTD